jgi:hypothetical protein
MVFAASMRSYYSRLKVIIRRLTECGGRTVTLWTHTVHGLNRSDFIMAAKIDSLALEP